MTHLIGRRAFAGALLAGGALALGSRVRAQGPLLPTPASPEGPFYPVALPADSDADMVHVTGRPARAAGQVIEVSGRLLDRRGNPIAGVIDFWQANAAGRYLHPLEVSTAAHDPNFEGFARLRTGPDGAWRITTVKPGAYDSPVGLRVPHIHLRADGASQRLIAQMYFPEEAAANAGDNLYRGLGADGPRSVATAAGAGRYVWDIILAEG
jgi:protocatechuate 3,4-dioxygenase, beta subunit